MGSVSSILYPNDGDVFGRTSFAISIKDAKLRNEFVESQIGRGLLMSLFFALLACVMYGRCLFQFMTEQAQNGQVNSFLDGPLPFLHTGFLAVMLFFMILQFNFSYLLHFTPHIIWICIVLPLFYLPENQASQGETTMYVSLLIMHLHLMGIGQFYFIHWFLESTVFLVACVYRALKFQEKNPDVHMYNAMLLPIFGVFLALITTYDRTRLHLALFTQKGNRSRYISELLNILNQIREPLVVVQQNCFAPIFVNEKGRELLKQNVKIPPPIGEIEDPHKDERMILELQQVQLAEWIDDFENAQMDDRAVLDGTGKKIATDFREHVRQLEFLINQQETEFNKIQAAEKQNYANSNQQRASQKQTGDNFLVDQHSFSDSSASQNSGYEEQEPGQIHKTDPRDRGTAIFHQLDSQIKRAEDIRILERKVRGFVAHPMFSRIMNAEDKKKALDVEMEQNYQQQERQNIDQQKNEQDRVPKLSLKEILQEIETEKRNLKQMKEHEAQKKKMLKSQSSQPRLSKVISSGSSKSSLSFFEDDSDNENADSAKAGCHAKFFEPKMEHNISLEESVQLWKIEPYDLRDEEDIEDEVIEETRQSNFRLHNFQTTFKGEQVHVITLEDVQAKIRVKEVEEKNQSLEKIQAFVSHEMRTPIGIILQFLDQLKYKMQGDVERQHPQLREIAQVLLFQANLLNSFVNDILDMFQIKEGFFTLLKTPFNLTKVLNNTYTMFTYQAKLQGTKLIYRVEEGFPDSVMGDKIRLEQILINLVKNALKFTHNGFIKMYANYNYDEGMVQISVQDTGIGIKREDLKKLFNMFGKLRNSEPGLNDQGIGLGLHICHQLVTQHQGQIWVSAKLNQGSDFSFTLKMPPVLYENELVSQVNKFVSQPDNKNGKPPTNPKDLTNQIINQVKRKNRDQTQVDKNKAGNFEIFQPSESYSNNSFPQQNQSVIVQRDESGSMRLQIGGLQSQNEEHGYTNNVPQLMDKEQCSVYKSSHSQFIREVRPENVVLQPKRISEVMLIDNGGDSMRRIFNLIGEKLGIKCEVALNGHTAMTQTQSRLRKGLAAHKLIVFDFTKPNQDEFVFLHRMQKEFENNTEIKLPYYACIFGSGVPKPFQKNLVDYGMKHFMGSEPTLAEIQHLFQKADIELGKLTNIPTSKTSKFFTVLPQSQE